MRIDCYTVNIMVFVILTDRENLIEIETLELNMWELPMTLILKFSRQPCCSGEKRLPNAEKVLSLSTAILIGQPFSHSPITPQGLVPPVSIHSCV